MPEPSSPRAKPGSRAAPGYPVSSVGNALELLKLLKDTPRLRVAEAARTLDVSPSTAHRLLAMLTYHGFVAQDKATRAYVAGPALLELGLAVIHENGLADRARPLIEALRDRVNETVNLAILDGAEVLVIAAVQPDRFVQIAPRVGHRSPAHWNATGKALLAELPDAEIAAVMPERLEVATPRTLRTRRALMAEIRRVRAAGYATNLGEFEEEMGAVGAVVRNRAGQAVAGLAVTALLSRIEPRVADVAELVLRTAADIEALVA